MEGKLALIRARGWSALWHIACPDPRYAPAADGQF